MKREKKQKKKTSPCGLPPNLVEMPNCKKQEDKAEQMKQFPSRADWEGVIPQACFPRMFSSTGLPSSFPCPRQVPLKSRRLNALQPRSDSVLCLVCGRVDGKGNDYWAGAQCKESRGGELSRHPDRTALDGEEVAPRSGLSMSHFTPYKRQTSRQCTSVWGYDDEEEKNKRTEQCG